MNISFAAVKRKVLWNFKILEPRHCVSNGGVFISGIEGAITPYNHAPDKMYITLELKRCNRLREIVQQKTAWFADFTKMKQINSSLVLLN